MRTERTERTEFLSKCKMKLTYLHIIKFEQQNNKIKMFQINFQFRIEMYLYIWDSVQCETSQRLELKIEKDQMEKRILSPKFY